MAAATGKSLDFFADKGYNVNMKTAGDVNAFVQKGFASFFIFKVRDKRRRTVCRMCRNCSEAWFLIKG